MGFPTEWNILGLKWADLREFFQNDSNHPQPGPNPVIGAWPCCSGWGAASASEAKQLERGEEWAWH